MATLGRLGLWIVTAAALGLGGGCHTIEGAGKDLQNLGRGMQHMANQDPPPPRTSESNPYEYEARH